jgi:hypothetical protein
VIKKYSRIVTIVPTLEYLNYKVKEYSYYRSQLCNDECIIYYMFPAVWTPSGISDVSDISDASHVSDVSGVSGVSGLSDYQMYNVYRVYQAYQM